MNADRYGAVSRDEGNHNCVACREIVSPDSSTMRFTSRYQDPPGNANGGVVVGALTCVARRASGLADPGVRRITARLHRGIPQDRDLVVTTSGPNAHATVDVTVSDRDAVIVSGTVSMVESAELARGLPPTLYGPARVQALSALAEPSGAHREFSRANPRRRPLPEPNPFGRCFVCGTDNPDGLQVRAEPIAAGFAWAPNPRADGFAERDGRLDTVIAIASLDCPSVPCVDAVDVLADHEDVLLGTFDGEFLRLPPATVPGGYRLPSQFIERSGRRVLTDIGLVGADGTAYAIATATWVTVPRQLEAARAQPSGAA